MSNSKTCIPNYNGWSPRTQKNLFTLMVLDVQNLLVVTIISTAKYQNCGGPLQNFGQTFGPSLFQNYVRPLVPLIQ